MGAGISTDRTRSDYGNLAAHSLPPGIDNGATSRVQSAAECGFDGFDCGAERARERAMLLAP
jgi:hypothetical protein